VMDDCEVCKPDPRPAHKGPGVPVQMIGTRHRVDCPLIPTLTPSEELRKQLAEVRDCERRAWEMARGWVIG